MDIQSNKTIPEKTDKDFEELFPEIIKFLRQSTSEKISTATKGYLTKFKGLEVEISFGQTIPANVSWICFLKDGQKVQNGYYPGLYFDRELSQLFVVLGVSEANLPKQIWPLEFSSKYNTFGKIDESKMIKKKYKNSFRFSSPYKIDKNNIEKSLESEKDRLFSELNQVIEVYKKSSEENNMNSSNNLKNPTESLMQELLEKKKQIILYGPPGPEKTFYANKFIADKSHPYQIAEKSLLDQRVFSLTTYAPNIGDIPNLKAKDKFTYEWKGKRNWQCYFDMIQEGDTAITYHANSHKYTTVVKCIRKTDESLEFLVLHQFNGVTYEKMKSDPILSESDLVRVGMSFSLRQFNEKELQRIIELSQDLTYEKLEVKVNKSEETVENKRFITFHPSFGYEDFIEGLRPYTDTNEQQLRFQVEEGIFKKFAKQACNVLFHKAEIDKEWKDGEGIPDINPDEREKIIKTAPSVPFYLIIDEINRGDISRIFGELITLIEADKRYGEKNEPNPSVQLPYSKKKFAIPPNLLIIGTMNTADKSIALVDIALRRRFGFIEMMPDYSFLKSYLSNDNKELQNISTNAVDLLVKINQRISANFDRDHQIGHSYFTKLKDAGTRDEAIKTLHFVWYHEILPLLQEYYNDSPKKLHEILGDKFVTLSEDKRRFQFREPLNGGDFLNAIKDLAQNTTSQVPDNRMN